MTLRVANAAGFLGDRLDAAQALVESAEIDYLTLEYLAELTLSILAGQRSRDPARGYASDFLDVLQSLVEPLRKQDRLRIVTNAGGVNPRGCAGAAGRLLTEAGLGETPIAVVMGDDILSRLPEIQAGGYALANLDTGRPLADIPPEAIATANVYLGAGGIVDALAAGGRIAITGRVADASLTLGPAVHHFGWSWTDWKRLAGGSVAGHLIECGAQVTGGYSNRWRDSHLASVGYPIAELEASGECCITKPAGSGGRVDRLTVAEQLLYEIGDPAHYLTPDVDCNFTTVSLRDLGGDRVHVSGASGAPPPETLKVSLAYRAGFTAAHQLVVAGRDCAAKARECGEIIFSRLAAAGMKPEESCVELLGTGGGKLSDPPEVVLRIAAADRRRETIERFVREFAPLVTSGPAGIAGYAVPRPAVRERILYWPTLIPRDLVKAKTTVQSAARWAEGVS